jgi:hypothetical protein
MIGTLNHVSPEMTEAVKKVQAAQPQVIAETKPARPNFDHSPPPLETNLAGKPFYVNMQGQKIGSVINDQV